MGCHVDLQQYGFLNTERWKLQNCIPDSYLGSSGPQRTSMVILGLDLLEVFQLGFVMEEQRAHFCQLLAPRTSLFHTESLLSSQDTSEGYSGHIPQQCHDSPVMPRAISMPGRQEHMTMPSSAGP